MAATPHGAAYTQLAYPQPQGTPILQALTMDVSNYYILYTSHCHISINYLQSNSW